MVYKCSSCHNAGQFLVAMSLVSIGFLMLTDASL